MEGVSKKRTLVKILKIVEYIMYMGLQGGTKILVLDFLCIKYLSQCSQMLVTLEGLIVLLRCFDVLQRFWIRLVVAITRFL